VIRWSWWSARHRRGEPANAPVTPAHADAGTDQHDGGPKAGTMVETAIDHDAIGSMLGRL
jgi:hypothetical protein